MIGPAKTCGWFDRNERTRAMLSRAGEIGGILVICFAWGCSEAGLKAHYEVRIPGAGSDTIDVRLRMTGLSRQTLTLKAYESEDIIRLSNLTVSTPNGSQLEYRMSEPEDKSVTLYTVNTKDAEELVVGYRVQPGKTIGEGHGLHPLEVSGYLGSDFGLMSGRNLFLVPISTLAEIIIDISVPENWAVATTWPAVANGRHRFSPAVYEGGPEDLLNGTLGVGALTAYENTVGGTPVRAFVYTQWPRSTQRKMADRVFDLYRHVSQTFDAPIPDPYTVIFTPKTSEGLYIHTFGTTHGYGREMDPPTETRWLSVAENMAYRWLRYSPHRMEFASVSDMWFVDGAAVYLGLMALVENKVATDIEPYLIEAYRNYNKDRLTNYDEEIVPANYYLQPSVSLRKMLRSPSLAFAHYIDVLIQRQSNGEHSLADVLALGYRRRKDLHLRDLVKKATQVDIGEFMEDHIRPQEHPEQPLWFDDRPAPGSIPKELAQQVGHSAIRDTLTLIATGRTANFLEACGCKSSMSGGITRRATLIRQIKERRRNTLVMDAGNAFPFFTDVPKMDEVTSSEIDTYLEALNRMGYGFSVIARNELHYGGAFLRQKLKHSPIPLISASVHMNGDLISQPFAIADVGEYKIGFIGLVSPSRSTDPSIFEENTWGLSIKNPVDVVHRYMTDLAETVDLVGVVGEVHTELVHELIREVPSLDLIVTTGHEQKMVDALHDGTVSGQIDALYGFLDDVLVLYANAEVYGLHQFDLGVDSNGRIASFQGDYLEAVQGMKEEEKMKAFLEDYYREVAKMRPCLQAR